MNYEMFYTMAISNNIGCIYIFTTQILLFFTTMNFRIPTTGAMTSFLLSIIGSLVGIVSYLFLNSEFHNPKGAELKVLTLTDKRAYFKKAMLISYLLSHSILLLLFLTTQVVAGYYIYTGPLTLILLVAVITLHDNYLKNRYQRLKNSNWVFDYNRNPQIQNASLTNRISMPMFGPKNDFLYAKKNERLTSEDIFTKLPPGTLIRQTRMKKPGVDVLKFHDLFNYNGLDKYKEILLLKSNTENIKRINMYKNILSKYTNFYTYKENSFKCMRLQISINGLSKEHFVRQNEYIKKYVNASSVEIESIAIKMRNDLTKLNTERFFVRNAEKIKYYKLVSNENQIDVSEIINGVEKEAVDISYLKPYMSHNIEEYHCIESITQAGDLPLEESIKGNFYEASGDDIEEEDLHKPLKTLYKLKLNDLDIYAFKEDFRRVGEIDEMIVNDFINKEIIDKMKVHNFID